MDITKLTKAQLIDLLARAQSSSPYQREVGVTDTTDPAELADKSGKVWDVWKRERYTESGILATFLIKKNGGYMEYHIDQRWTQGKSRRPLVGMGAKDTVRLKAQFEYLNSPEFKEDCDAMVAAQRAYQKVLAS